MPANVYTSITSQTLTTNSSTISLSGFSGYTDLRIVMAAFTNANSDPRLTFNSSGSGYGQIIWDGYTNVTGAGTNEWYVSPALSIAYLYGNKAVNSTTIPNYLVIDIPYYARTDTNHMFKGEGGGVLLSTGQNFYERDVIHTQWANTSAISTIQIAAGLSASFTAGTIVSVYGITEA